MNFDSICQQRDQTGSCTQHGQRRRPLSHVVAMLSSCNDARPAKALMLLE